MQPLVLESGLTRVNPPEKFGYASSDTGGGWVFSLDATSGRLATAGAGLTPLTLTPTLTPTLTLQEYPEIEVTPPGGLIHPKQILVRIA